MSTPQEFGHGDTLHHLTVGHLLVAFASHTIPSSPVVFTDFDGMPVNTKIAISQQRGGAFDGGTVVAIQVDELAAFRRGVRQARVADLDGTADAADWIQPGHVLDTHEVEYLRSLMLPKAAK